MTRDRALLFEDVRLIEKRIRQLPPVRVSEGLELALMRLAAADDRSLSDYIRHVLERHAFGHVPSVGADGEQPSERRA